MNEIRNNLIEQFEKFLQYIKETEPYLLSCSLSMLIRKFNLRTDDSVIDYIIFLWKHRCMVLSAFIKWAELNNIVIDNITKLKKLLDCDKDNKDN